MSLGSCQPEPESDNNGLLIGTSLPVFGSIISELIQDDDTVFMLLSEQGSPHNFQPRPSHILNLKRSNIIFLGDPELDGWASELADTEVHFFSDLLLNQSILKTDGYRNSHFWMDPVLVHELSYPVAEILCHLRESACHTYRRRAVEFAGSLETLHGEIQEALSGLQNRAVITSHPFFDYFLFRYEISSVITLEPVPGNEPSSALIIKTIQASKKNPPAGLIAHAGLPDEAINLIRDETNLALVHVNPLGLAGQTYPDFIRMSAQKVLNLESNTR